MSEQTQVSAPEEEQIDWAYCHNPDCQINAHQVYHPIDETPLGLDEYGREQQPCSCPDLDHPHQAICQCGDVMRARPIHG